MIGCMSVRRAARGPYTVPSSIAEDAMEFWQEYALFAAKTVTLVLAVAMGLGVLAGLGRRGRRAHREHLEVTRLDERFRQLKDALQRRLLDKRDYKAWAKARKREQKRREARRRVFVLDFRGDLRASRVESLRQEITAIVSVADPEDEVVLRLESPGGAVAGYGLAASQLARLRERGVRLTVAVDRVAASGGYMMACVADTVLAAPFAMVGSIGVVAQLPNFHRLLKKHDIDFELITAGRYKRTLTVFGENTEEGREKFAAELEDIHELFKDFIRRYRPQIDMERVATGEFWLGERALQLGLVDRLQTSDEYLLQAGESADLVLVNYHHRPPLSRRLSLAFESLLARAGQTAGHD
jgi:serine protease SohB